MKKILKNSKFLFVGAIVLGIFSVSWSIRIRCQSVYSDLISDEQTIEAFYRGDAESIIAASNSKNLNYQKVVNGNIVYSSSQWLPKPDIITYQRKITDGVIYPSTMDILKTRQYYKIFKGPALYIMVPICTKVCDSEMYLVYKKAVL